MPLNYDVLFALNIVLIIGVTMLGWSDAPR